MQATTADTIDQASSACDVLIIGGGPGGSTAATFLARQGLSVIVLEKEHHPRFHIGESMLPMSLPVFERLGVLDKVHALGVHKPGADFESDTPRGYTIFDFGRALGSSPPHAYEVYREDFDQMLFEHARGEGADMREGMRVTDVEHLGPREHRITARSQQGTHQFQARFVIDASGRDALLSTRKKLKRKNTRHQTTAVFGHFTGAEFRAGKEAGNISVYRFGDNGWAWMIPLPKGLMSVGVVATAEFLKQRQGSLRDLFIDTLQSNPGMWKRLQNATLVDDKVHTAANFTYDSTTLGGPGWLLIGDAFGFLDPVFSSGVYLALSSGEKAAGFVDTVLREPHRETALRRKMEKKLRLGFKRFSFFIYRFNNPIMAEMFSHPSNPLGIEQGIISMLAGDIYDNPAVLRRLWMFHAIYNVNVLLGFRSWWREWRKKRRSVRDALVE